MASNRGKRALDGAQICREICTKTLDQRQMFALQELCEIAEEAFLGTAGAESYAPRELCVRFVAVTAMGWNSGATSSDDAAAMAAKHTPPMQARQLFWQCLQRISDFTTDERLRSLISAWQDAWGDGDKAIQAKRRFAALAPIKRSRKPWNDYLHEGLLLALENVKA